MFESGKGQLVEFELVPLEYPRIRPRIYQYCLVSIQSTFYEVSYDPGTRQGSGDRRGQTQLLPSQGHSSVTGKQKDKWPGNCSVGPNTSEQLLGRASGTLYQTQEGPRRGGYPAVTLGRVHRHHRSIGGNSEKLEMTQLCVSWELGK